jgi:membrane protein YdbS with pleckstrin-like domain
MKQAIGSNTEDVLKLAGVTLLEDERMLGVARIHGAIYWKGVAVTIIGLLLLPTFAMSLGFFLIFVGLMMIGLAHLTRSFLVLAATDKRIFIRSGILYADMTELRHTQIESIELGITPIGQIFGYASVIVTGTGQRRVMVPFVANGIAFRKSVNDILVNK